MAFPDGYLNDGEKLVLNLKPHWWVFAQSSAFVVLALVIAVLLQAGPGTPVSYVGWVLLVAALLNLAVVYGKWSTTYFVLSNERLIFRTGVLTKRGVELPIDRIDNINFRQSLFERIIGAGDLLIESAGESGQSRFGNVRKPEAVQNEIYRQIDDRRHGPRTAPPPMAPPPVAAAEAGPASAAPAQDEIATKIRELDALRRQGLVSDEEFETKRRDLLDRM